jgi:1-acyl-sn-glycerol-3-phosphate acyltransferase
MSPRAPLSRIAGAIPAPIAGIAPIARAGLGGAARRVDPRQPAPDADPFELRDPDYIRLTTPLVRAVAERYFRAEVRGLEHIPRDGPVLLVGNHSGGWIIVDTFIFGQAFIDRFGAERPFFQLTHDLVFRVPGLGEMIVPFGAVPASPGNMRRAMEQDAAVLVYPGGDVETYRASWHEADIDFAHRTGFARLALELGVPIVPVVAIGGQETALFLGSGERLARALQLHRLLRLDVLPIQIGPPWGVTVLDLPGRWPLPAKITVEALPAIDLAAELGAGADPEAAYDLVTGRMQEALDRLAAARRFPIIG